MPSGDQTQERPTDDKTDVRPLDPGKTVVRELSAGRTNVYSIALTTGQFIQITVEQKGINVALTLVAPDGNKVGETNLTTTLARESLSYEVTTAGVFRLAVKAVAPTPPIGTYELRVELKAAATSADKQRIRAERLVEHALILAVKRGAPTRQAIDEYQEAVNLWRELGDRYWEAHTLYRMGVANFLLSNYEPARDFFNRSLIIRREITDRAGEGSSLTALGNVCGATSRYQEAIQFYEQALAIRRELKDLIGEEATLNDLGNAYRLQSQYEKSIEYYNQALELSRELKDRINEGAILNNLASAFNSLGRNETALESYNQALAISRELKDRAGEEAKLTNLAALLNQLGRHEEALNELREALLITRDLKDRINEAIVLDNLGRTNIDLGQYEQAIGYYEQGLAIHREIKNRAGEGLALSGLGQVLYYLKRYEEARNCEQQAAAIAHEVKNLTGEETALTNLGAVYRQLRQYPEAAECFDHSLAIAREIKEPSHQAIVLYQFAKLERDRGNISRARELIEESLPLAESLRAAIYSHRIRTFYFASFQEFYQLYIDLLMRLHESSAGPANEEYVRLALEENERSRARSLLELLTEARAEIRQGADPGLLAQERDLKRQLATKAEDRTRLLTRSHSAEQLAALDREIENREEDFQRVQAAIRRASPRYAALTQPQPLSTAEIEQTLDANTILLEYALGQESSYLFALTQTSIACRRLPPRSEIEAVAEKLYRELIAGHAVQGKPGKPIAELDGNAGYLSDAAELSRILLGPVASQLGSKRLLIVAPGPLEYIPFAVLPEPATDERTNSETRSQESAVVDAKPLIVSHEIISLPSASVLAALRAEAKGRPSNAKSVAVFADPVFSGSDPRVRPRANAPAARGAGAIAHRSGDIERAVGEMAGPGERGSLPRLPFSRAEAEAIISSTPAGSAFKALDFDANLSSATGGDLGRYRIVHFATHGLLDTKHPELSGLIFSLVDRSGHPQDGFLRLHDIYNLRLPVEVVVLSACQTGLGQQIQGEGLMGLTRGFMYAGAERVVASMWQVDDVATSELMRRFYQGMFKSGMTPAGALRAAQVEMWNHKQWRAPYYWGAFVLQGDWR